MTDRQNKIIKILLWITAIVFLARLVSLGFTPMFDTTEARYAEIGRLMYETGNWLTPQFDYGVPFWGKPPLSFWATAASFKIFGVNDFAARLPHFLFMLGITILIYFFVKKHLGRMAAAVSAAVLSTITAFIYLAGGVMTDPAMALWVTLAMIAFYNAIFGQERRKLWSYLLFASIGLGIITKGPLILVISGIPMLLMILFKNKWREMFRTIPWITGIALMLIISLPWYIMAERATPGFIEYFIIGEHFMRYVVSGWTGDLYGYGRGGYPGQMIVFWLQSLMPWLIWIAVMLFSKCFLRFLFSRELIKNDFLLFIMMNIATPLIFFSLSRNVVPNYVLMILPPSAIIISWLICKNDNDEPKLGKFKFFAGLNITLFAAIIAVGALYPKWSADVGRSDRFLVKTYLAERTDDSAPLFYFWNNRSYSSLFYSDGKILQTENLADIRAAAANGKKVFVIVQRAKKSELLELKGMQKDIVTSGKKTVLVKLWI